MLLMYGDTDSPLIQMEEGAHIHMDCSVKARGNITLNLYNGTNPVSCHILDNMDGKISVLYFVCLIYNALHFI